MTLCDGQRLRLPETVGQHERGDVFGHLGEQAIALLLGELSQGDHLIEQNFQIHLVVRTIDAARVVDEVRVDASAGEREFDPRRLRHAEVAAFAEHLGAQFRSVHPDGVVCTIAYIDVGFFRRFDISTDASVEDQVDGRLEQRVNQFVR